MDSQSSYEAKELSPPQILNLYTSGVLALNLLLAFLFYTQPEPEKYRLIGIAANIFFPVIGTFVLILNTPRPMPRDIERRALTLTLIPVMSLGLWILSFMITARDSRIVPVPAGASVEATAPVATDPDADAPPQPATAP